MQNEGECLFKLYVFNFLFKVIELSLRNPKAPDEVERVKANLNYVAHFSDYITAFFYVSLLFLFIFFRMFHSSDISDLFTKGK